MASLKTLNDLTSGRFNLKDFMQTGTLTLESSLRAKSNQYSAGWHVEWVLIWMPAAWFEVEHGSIGFRRVSTKYAEATTWYLEALREQLYAAV